MRVINQNEWALLDLTLRLIAKYGAIGGKTVFKPSDEKGRQNLLYHRDFGLIEIVSTSSNINPDYSTMKEYVFLKRWRKVEHGDFAWASLKNFWCVNGKYLARQDQNKSTFNQVLGRKKQDKSGKDEKGKRVIRRIELLDSQNDTISKWLVGSQQESKKVFSFKNPPRAFGFIKPGLIEFREMKQRLEKAWGKGDWRFLTGEEIGQKLVGSEGVGE
jgi:CRISPR-associated protein Cmr1